MISQDGPAAGQTGGRPAEEPLTSAQLTTLSLKLAAIATSFYLLTAVTLILASAYSLLLLAILLLLTRVHLSGLLMSPLEAMFELIINVALSLNIAKRPEHVLDVTREDATGLWRLVTETADRIGVKPPKRLVTTASIAARMISKGGGIGSATLSIGYDLIAILTVTELQSVIAHEMAYTRLVQHGFSGWIGNAVSRMTSLDGELLDLLKEKRKKRRFFTAELLQRAVSKIAHNASNLMAQYSRQNEFAADRIAASVVGDGAMASALVSIAIADFSDAPSWSSRIAQFQRGGSLVPWLRAQLAPSDLGKRQQLFAAVCYEQELLEYDSHPRLEDRLLHLGVTGYIHEEGSAASDLMSDPGGLAGRLIAMTERKSLEDQRAASARLKKVIRMQKRQARRTWGEIGGVFFCLIGLFFGFISVAMFVQAIHDAGGTGAAAFSVQAVVSSQAAGAGFFLFVVTAILMGTGIAIFRMTTWRDKPILPSPSFGRFRRSLLPEVRFRDWNVERGYVLAELIQASAGMPKKGRAAADYWAAQAYAAIAACDYQRAGLAADLCLKIKPKHIPGRVVIGIAAVYFDAVDGTIPGLGSVLLEYGASRSVSWAIGWCQIMNERYDLAEGYLHDAADRRPGDATVLGALAMCQGKLGKVLQAFESVDRAIILASEEVDLKILQVQLFLDAGRAIEATNALDILARSYSSLTDLPLLQVRACLLLDDRRRADEICSTILDGNPQYSTMRMLAQAYKETGDFERYAELQALSLSLRSIALRRDH